MHRPLWDGVIQSLQEIFHQRYPADKVIQRQMKMHRKWGSKDRRLFAECVYEMVRWWRKILFVADIPWPKSDEWSSSDRAVYERATCIWMGLNGIEAGKGVPAPLTDPHFQNLWQDPSLPRAVRESVPEWLDQWGAQQLGDRWNQTLNGMNSSAPVFLRVNRLKSTTEKVIQLLAQENIVAKWVEADALMLEKRANVFPTRAFQQGLFEVQDLNSQKVAPALNPLPGQRIVDACAGAGGKSLHLAALMANKGKILSLDVFDKKLQELRVRASRAGATLIETRLIDSSKVIKRLEDTADGLLLDVPCTGLGVIRRNPDKKWKLKLDDVARLTELQKDILQKYSRIVKKGGTMIYATCSVMPEENGGAVQHFLSHNPQMFDLEFEQTWMLDNGGDGFYLARLIRKS